MVFLLVLCIAEQRKNRVEQVEEWLSMKLCMQRGVVSTRECLSLLGR